MALICLAFIVAAVAGFCFDNTAWITAGIVLISVVVCAAILIFCVKSFRKTALLVLAMAVAAIVSLAISYGYFEVKYDYFQSYIEQQVVVEGRVISRKYSNSYSSGYEVEIDKFNGEDISFCAILDCEYVSDLQPGYVFELPAICDQLGYGDSDDIINEISDGYMIRLVS